MNKDQDMRESKARIGCLTFEGDPHTKSVLVRINSGCGPIDCGLTHDEWNSLVNEADALEMLRARLKTANRDLDRLGELAMRLDESHHQHEARLGLLLGTHLDECGTCNYDRDCIQCEVDDGGRAHSCNCGHGPGYGYQLNQAKNRAVLVIRGLTSVSSATEFERLRVMLTKAVDFIEKTTDANDTRANALFTEIGALP